MEPKLFLHAGLPRTATTVLQQHVFPRLERVRFIGKNPDNTVYRGTVQPIKLIREASAGIRRGNQQALELVRRLLPTLLMEVKLRNRDHNEGDALRLGKLWIACVREIAKELPDLPLLYSDESLSESLSGIAGRTEMGDGIALEQFQQLGLLEQATLSVVLRDPAQFLKASYYKAAEFDHKYKRDARSFQSYLEHQLELLNRKATASRIFLACQRRAAAHFRSLCPRTIVTLYDDLVTANDTVASVFGQQLSAVKWPMSSLPRENPSWRNEDVNRFILSAPGVPAGLTIQDYAATFPETLEKLGLARMLEEERLPRAGADK